MDQGRDTYLWTAEEVAAITGGRWETAPEPGLGYTSLAYNANEIRPGCLFFTRDPRAWRGRKEDGVLKANRNADRGAATIVIDRVPKNWAGQCPLLVVDNTRDALMALATAGRARFKGKVIAITGSVGKTTTKEFLRQGLGRQARVAASGNMHSHGPGVGLMLAALPPDADYAVVEVGLSREKHSVRDRVAFVKPHIAVVTDVGYDHMKHRDSLDEVAMEKAEIFSGVVPGGIAVINRDTPAYRILLEAADRHGVAETISVGWGDTARSRVRDLSYGPAHSAQVAAVVDGEEIAYRLALPGRPAAFCALIALTVAKAAGADWRAMAGQLVEVLGPPQRMERFSIAIPGGTVVVYDDNYNANPLSYKACLETIAALPHAEGGRKIGVLTDMAGMGERSAQFHRDLADPVRDVGFDLLFTWGEDILLTREALGNALPPGRHCATVKEAAAAVLAAVEPGDLIVLKGSDPKPEVTALDQVLHAIQVYAFTGRRAMI